MLRPIIFISAWLVLSLIQAATVRLTSDEGYYWFYSNHLQWGYYDHPPMIALMIKAGSFIFNNELGVRLVNVFMMSGAFLLFFFLLPLRLRNDRNALILLLSQPLLHYFSIIVFPDGPLIFFSLLFLLGYKRWLDRNDILSALLMGLSLAGMLYSKYHGFLVLLFTILSNFRLLRSKWFWLSIGMASVLALPHLWWQFKNEFPSFQYHLQKRITGLDISVVGQYISQQLPAFGPVFLFAAVAAKSKNEFQRTLKFIVWGTLIFFLFISLKGFVHFHWTSIAIFPVVYLAIIVFENKNKQRLLYWLTIPFIIIILLFRVHIVRSFIPVSPRDLGYYQYRDNWAKQISQLAGDQPVIFVEDFRDAGLYGFYTRKTSLTLFNYQKRRTQYDMWGYEDSVQGRSVLVIDKHYHPQSKEVMSVMQKKFFYRHLPHFQSFYNMPVAIRQAEIKKDSLFLSTEITNNRVNELIFYNDPVYGSPELIFRIMNKKNDILHTGSLKSLDSSDRIHKNGMREYFFTTQFAVPKEDCWLEVGFRASGLPVSINARERISIIEK